MQRIFIPIVFISLFIIWFLYRAIVKKDIKKNLSKVYLGLFFIVNWGVIYWLLLK